MGFVWSAPVSSKDMTGREQTAGGGGERIIGVGVQPVFGEGFMVCFRGPKIEQELFFLKLFGHSRDIPAKIPVYPPKQFDFPGF